MKPRTLLTLSLLLFTPFSQAADLSSLKSLFQKEFYSNYEEGKCGLNIDGFVKKAYKAKIDLTCAMLVQIDGGGDVYVKYARSSYGEPSKKTWFHHYIMVAPTNSICKTSGYALRETDYVIDFDFSNSPRVVPLKDYLEAMFIPNRVVSDPKSAQSDFTMGITSFSVVDANAYIKAMKEPDPKRAAILKAKAVVIDKVTLRNVYLKMQ